ncbi:MAG: GNAT family N-acetyltransferase [Clostridiales bacterium 43-6]|nr:MAG: GNAT family N-acetyltransferase [Clostridiales bacterium 43-6]
MNMLYGDFLLSDDTQKIQLDRVCEMLSTTYWANNRSKEAIEESIKNSLCFGIYKDDIQIGFARCVTDYATMYWLGDVIIDEKYRGIGLGKFLIKSITEHEEIAPCFGLLGTKDAHGLYEKFGFVKNQGTAMGKPPESTK